MSERDVETGGQVPAYAADGSDILLVNPTGGWGHESDGRFFFPIGLLYLKNFLLKHGIASQVVDVKPEGLTPESFRERIARQPPRIIGFTGSPFERHSLHAFIRGIRDGLADGLIVVGGPYFTATAEDCLRCLPDVDVVVRGEGEETFLEIVRAAAEGRPFDGIDGITYRAADGGIQTTPNRPPADRDACEIPVSQIPADDTYDPFVTLKNYEAEGIKALPVLLSRGCLKHCTFCFNNNNGRFSSRSVDSVIEEIQGKRERFGCDHFWMVDPAFTLRWKFAHALCDALIERCPGIKWYCETRADCELELLQKMARAGCISIDFALESGAPRVLQAIRKDLDPACVVGFARECRRLGIRALVFVMYSLPGETWKDFLMTMDVLERIRDDIHAISFGPTLILPGTQMEQQARESGMLPPDFSWYDETFLATPKWQERLSWRERLACHNRLERYQLQLRHQPLGLRWQVKRLLLNPFIASDELAVRLARYPRLHAAIKRVATGLFGGAESG